MGLFPDGLFFLHLPLGLEGQLSNQSVDLVAALFLFVFKLLR